MEWLIPIALSIMILNETERCNRVRKPDYSMDNSKFSQRDSQPASVSGVPKPETMGRQNRKAGKRPTQDENKTGDSV